MRSVRFAWASALAALALLVAACGTSPPVRYYTLGGTTSAERAGAPGHGASGYTVAVGPVSVPAAVDRPQIVIQVAANRVALLDDQRWAEPLNSAIPNAIASDLGQLLGASTVLFPRDSMTDVKYRVAVEIRDFRSQPGEAATIDAAWTVFGPHDSLKRGSSIAREPVTQTDLEALAAAHARALMKISREVAATITSMESGQ